MAADYLTLPRSALDDSIRTPPEECEYASLGRIYRHLSVRPTKESASRYWYTIHKTDDANLRNDAAAALFKSTHLVRIRIRDQDGLSLIAWVFKNNYSLVNVNKILKGFIHKHPDCSVRVGRDFQGKTCGIQSRTMKGQVELDGKRVLLSTNYLDLTHGDYKWVNWVD